MIKEKGFTLVELLAVIVILAVLLAVSVPTIGNIIQNSRKNAFKNTASEIVRAANFFYSNPMGSQTTKDYTFSFDNSKNGTTDEGYKLDLSGNLPTEGRLILTANGKTDLNVCDDTYCACKGEGTATVFIVDKSVEICGTNDDGSTADNPVTSGQISQLESRLDNLETTIDGINAGFLDKTYPVGSIYVSVSNKNPSTIFGGEWVAYSQGRTLIGVGAGTDVNSTSITFNTSEDIGGEYTHKLNVSEMPSHTHIQDPHTHVQNPHSHDVYANSFANDLLVGMYSNGDSSADGSLYGVQDFQHDNYRTSYKLYAKSVTATNQNATATNQNTGGDAYHNNVEPYVTVYMWKRIN